VPDRRGGANSVGLVRLFDGTGLESTSAAVTGERNLARGGAGPEERGSEDGGSLGLRTAGAVAT